MDANQMSGFYTVVKQRMASVLLWILPLFFSPTAQGTNSPCPGYLTHLNEKSTLSTQIVRDAWEAKSDSTFIALFDQIPLPFELDMHSYLRAHLIHTLKNLKTDPLFESKEFGISLKREEDEPTIRRLIRIATAFHDYDKYVGEHGLKLSQKSGIHGALDKIEKYFDSHMIPFPENHRRFVSWLITNHDLFGEYFQGHIMTNSWKMRVESAKETKDGFLLGMYLSDMLKATQFIFEADIESYPNLQDRYQKGEFNTNEAWMKIWYHFFYDQEPSHVKSDINVGGKTFHFNLIKVPARLMHWTNSAGSINSTGLLPSLSSMYGLYTAPEGEVSLHQTTKISVPTSRPLLALDLEYCDDKIEEIGKLLGIPKYRSDMVLGHIAYLAHADVLHHFELEYIFLSGSGLPQNDRLNVTVNQQQIRSPLFILALLRGIRSADAAFRTSVLSELPQYFSSADPSPRDFNSLVINLAQKMSKDDWKKTADELFKSELDVSPYLQTLQVQILHLILDAPYHAKTGELNLFELPQAKLEAIREFLFESSIFGGGLPLIETAMSEKQQNDLFEMIQSGNAARGILSRHSKSKAQFLRSFIVNILRGATNKSAESWANFLITNRSAVELDNVIQAILRNGQYSWRLHALIDIPVKRTIPRDVYESVVQDYLGVYSNGNLITDKETLYLLKMHWGYDSLDRMYLTSQELKRLQNQQRKIGLVLKAVSPRYFEPKTASEFKPPISRPFF